MKDLLKLYSFYSVGRTKGEKEICDWICTYLDIMKISYERIDNTIYSFSKNNTVLLSAHLDQVATNGAAVHFYKEDNIIKGYNKNYQRTSLGADDKNGVWIILKLLERGYSFDFIISECEECGGDGIRKVEKFIDTSCADYCIVLDRKGNNNILKSGGSTMYCEALAYNLKNFLLEDFQVTTGCMSDTQTICKYIESVNMSVAYFKPHTAEEYTDYNRLIFILKCIEDVVSGRFVHYPALPSEYTVKYSYKEKDIYNVYDPYEYGDYNTYSFKKEYTNAK